MATLVKHYLDNPTKNQVIAVGSEDDLKMRLDKIEAYTEGRNSIPSNNFYEVARMCRSLLRVCIYKNVDTEDEETVDINYSIV